VYDTVQRLRTAPTPEEGKGEGEGEGSRLDLLTRLSLPPRWETNVGPMRPRIDAAACDLGLGRLVLCGGIRVLMRKYDCTCTACSYPSVEPRPSTPLTPTVTLARGTNDHPQRGDLLATTEVYDSLTMQWSELPQLPAVRSPPPPP
jgi:hypothetical protein